MLHFIILCVVALGICEFLDNVRDIKKAVVPGVPKPSEMVANPLPRKEPRITLMDRLGNFLSSPWFDFIDQ